MEWRGTDVDKVGAMIDTFLATAHNKFPQIKNYRYAFSKRQFVDQNGNPGWGRLLQDIGLANQQPGRPEDGRGNPGALRAGESTLRRIIFIQSLVSSESGARPGILQQVLVGSRSLVQNGDLRALLRDGDHPFTLSGTNASDNSQTGLQVQAILASIEADPVTPNLR
ncbi:MAG: hypothetical protein VR73_03750 [Gammaproteobacteria bacterium BRH_c0]|nr:MAG: hypothetical protein VR73_03750 [Gammaproteobacteria bacterium BRH_c0]